MEYAQSMMLPYTAADLDRLSAEVVATFNEWEIARDDAKAATAAAKEAKKAFEGAVAKLKKARGERDLPTSGGR